MLRGPTLNDDGKPELDENEGNLHCCESCNITFGELSGNGIIWITTQRIIWITSSNDASCFSFSAPLTSLMVHALCKETDCPYLFLQLENQEDDIQIAHDSYDTLQALYEALCEGQRLNPCEGSSDEDGGNPFMGFGGFDAFSNEQSNEEVADDEKQQENGTESGLSEEQRMELMKEWESKLVLGDKQNVVNNNGYLEPAADGQFDDAENHEMAEMKESGTVQEQGRSKSDNPYLDPNLMKSLDQFAPKQNEKFEKKFAVNEMEQIDSQK